MEKVARVSLSFERMRKENENDSVWIRYATKMDDLLDSKVLLTNEFKAQIDYVVNNVEHFTHNN